ncbi:hypothetical protein FACS1894187_08520 [Synergistales bacterium]|nr:hypothetical protein FACS1894187_08520 [Synergistales bacterium]
MAMTVSGVASGIDWENMIEEVLEASRGPAYIQAAKRDKLELRKSLFEELRVDFQALQSALTPIKLASTFKAKQVNIDRLDSSGSYKGVLSATVSADAAVNVYDLEVLQIAKSQISRSDQHTGGAITTAGIGSYFYINAGGQKLRVNLDVGTNTISSIADKINNVLKTARPPVAVTASIVDNRIVLKSDNVGSGTETISSNLIRSGNSTDLIQFPLNADSYNSASGTYDSGMYTISTLNEGGGKLVITSGGTTYNEGVDFDVLSGGRIRWREMDNTYPSTNESYKIKYTMAAGETYTTTGTRSSGNVDKDVIKFNADVTAPTSRITISIGSFTYNYGTDFTISGNDIVWANASMLSGGTAYTVNYESQGSGNEAFELDVKRSVPDVLIQDALTFVPVDFSDFAGGTATITSASGRTYRQGADFDIVPITDPADPNVGKATIRWRAESAYIAPEPGESYTISLTDANGTVTAFDPITMANADDIDLATYGFGHSTPANPLSGTIQVSYNGKAFANGDTIDYRLTNPVAGTPTTFNIDWTLRDWATPGTPWLISGQSTARTTPAIGATYTATYTYDKNAFSFSDDGNGLLHELGFDNDDADHYSAGQDAILILDGERITRASNVISADNKNELIAGMTIELKGVGRVSLDVEHDAEPAVTAVQNLLTAYNDIMSWINVRETEKQLDETTKSTIDSDDFRMKWGLLHANPVLRTTKDALRRLTSQIYSPVFSTRTSRTGVYGDMGLNGLMANRIITISAGSNRVLSLQISPADTLNDIAARINSNTNDSGRPNPLKDYNADGTVSTQYVTAKVENGQLVLNTLGVSATLGGSTEALSVMGINYSYNTLSQIGIKLPSTGEMSDQGKTGELDFNTSAFMTALTNNADDVANLMTTFAAQMQTYIDNTIKTSQAEIGSGVVAVQGSLAREMNAIDDEIKRIDDYLAEFNRKQTEKETKLRAQYAASETTLARLMEQASWLSSVVSQLQGQQAS